MPSTIDLIARPFGIDDDPAIDGAPDFLYFWLVVLHHHVDHLGHVGVVAVVGRNAPVDTGRLLAPAGLFLDQLQYAGVARRIVVVVFSDRIVLGALE